MQEVAVIVGSHGEMAHYALKSAEMIVGAQSNVASISVRMDDTLESAGKQFEKAIENVDASSGIVILVDLFGGTPSNVAGKTLLERSDVLLISGLNLPMLIELLLNRHKTLAELSTMLEVAYRSGFTNMTELFKEREGQEDECSVL